MKIQELRIVRYIYYLALVGVVFSFVDKSWFSIRTIQITGSNIGHHALTSLLYLLGIAVVIYRLNLARKNGVKLFLDKNIETILMRRIGLFLMLTGGLFTFANEIIMQITYIVETRKLLPYLAYFLNGLEISIMGICMYELSRFIVAEKEDNKANAQSDAAKPRR